MESRHVLVTGGAGFLGSHLCGRLLAEGSRVTCLDNLSTGSSTNVAQFCAPDFQFIRHDVCRPLPVVDVDRIFHLACPASPVHYQRNPVRTIETTVQGTLNALELARTVKARLLIASTSEVYGEPLHHPQKEEHWGNVNPVGPRSCYDEGKRCAEALATSFSAYHGVDVRIARIFNTYGPRMQVGDGRVVSNFIVQVLGGQPLTVYGDGNQTRSFCYVSDLIDGLVRLMGCEGDPGPVNLGNPSEITIGELAAEVAGIFGVRPTMAHAPLPKDDPTRRQPDIERAIKVLSWYPTVLLRQGLIETANYFRRIVR